MLTRPMPIVSRLMIMMMILMLMMMMVIMMMVRTMCMFMRTRTTMFHLGKVSRSGAPGLCPGSATWRNTARFATFVCMSINYNDQHQHQHHLSHVLLLVEVDPVLVGGAYCVQGQEDVARNLGI